MCSALQVDRLREALNSKHDSQIVYLEVEHWTDFPHVPWGLLSQLERDRLDAHFRRCSIVAPYVTGQRKLPPPLPGT